MPAIRVEKVKGFTVISNYHFKDKTLSLKAKGLLSLMLSLPDDWNYTERGLTTLSSDGKASIHSALQELKEHKYLKVEQTRNENGVFSGSVYYIYEVPYNIDRADINTPEFTENSPCTENRDTVKQDADNRDTEERDAENPSTEKHSLLNTNIYNNKDINYDSNKNPHHSLSIEKRKEMRKKIEEQIGYNQILSLNESLMNLLDNDEIELETFNKKYVKEIELENIIEIVLDIYNSFEESISIGKEKIEKNRFLEKFEKLEGKDIKEIVHRIIKAKPSNKRLYILTVIWNY
jgi:hypothetical protein